jgi:hypothetical protein
MEEILDHLILRIIFVIFLLTLIFLYRYAHFIFYPIANKQINTTFNPLSSKTNTLHYFARILGISIVLTAVELSYFNNFFLGLTNFFVTGTCISILYLISIYLAESIVLYKFDYTDEILKKENMGYAICSFAICISQALILRQVFMESGNSLIIFTLLWLYSLVLFGLSTKFYKLYSVFNFNNFLIKKDVGVAISYAGFTLGNAFLFTICFQQQHFEIKSYATRVFLKILLCIILVPIFIIALKKIFGIRKIKNAEFEYSIHTGIVECFIYLAANILTAIIAFKINLSVIVPFAS